MMFKSSQKGIAAAKKPAKDAIESTMPKGQKPDIPKGTGGNVKAGKHHK